MYCGMGSNGAKVCDGQKLGNRAMNRAGYEYDRLISNIYQALRIDQLLDGIPCPTAVNDRCTDLLLPSVVVPLVPPRMQSMDPHEHGEI